LGNYLGISDLQIPYEHIKALEFCAYLKRHFKIPDDNIYNVGDELDNFHGGSWPKGAEYPHTPRQESLISKEKLKDWYAEFPKMKLAMSNHGSRWMRKAFHAEIPSEMLRKYEDFIGAPDGWIWKQQWKVDCKHPFIVEHGDRYGGQHPHIAAAMHNGMSTIIGHHHSKAAISYIKTAGLDIWACVAGSLIDFEQYAFEYGRNAKLQPQIGATVILNEGRHVIWIPME
jgi:hypothetical protein